MAGGVWREQPKRRLGLRRILQFFLAFALGYGFFLYLGKEKVEVMLATASQKDMPLYLSASGTVQAYNNVTLHTQIDGQLTEVLFHEGQEVHKGDVLARLDARKLQAQYDQAVANKAEDEAQLEALKRKQTPHKSKKKHKKEPPKENAALRQFETAVKSDQAAIDNAKMQLSYATIVSPINGRTGIRQVDVGNTVHTSDANGLVMITQMEPISVLFNVPQQKFAGIAAQMNAKAPKPRLWAMDGDDRVVVDIGELELVDNHVDAGGMLHLKGIFSNAKRLLWPDAAAMVRMQTGIRHNAVVVPASAIQHDKNGAYVFILKSSGDTVALQPVKVASVDGAQAVVDEGVQVGDQLVIESKGPLKNGSRVDVKAAAAIKKADDVPAPAKTVAPAAATKPPTK
jgi:multidrug efflux system membrane fusion protein